MKKEAPKVLLATLFVMSVYGCQQDKPIEVEAPLAIAPTLPSSQNLTPEKVSEDSGKPKPTEQIEKNKEVAIQPESIVAVRSPVIAPVAAKPAVKTEAVLSDAEARSLAQKSLCFACHSIERKVVGPAWKDVAAKYRGQKEMEAKLITKVSNGGGGVWGDAAMPANSPRVSDEDIKSLVRFVLSLK